MQTTSSNLEQTLESLPCPSDWPMTLPPVHLSEARSFGLIVSKGQLEPSMDEVFKEEVLYFFYGGVFHRTANRTSRNIKDLPVAFIFDPSVLTSIVRYYPFDTGALAAGRFGVSGKPLIPFEERFKVNGGDFTAPSRLVHHIYGSNDRYLLGDYATDLNSKPDPLPLLCDFFSADLSANGVDHRQCIIECHSNKPISLAKGLLWVGFPDCMTEDFIRLFKLTKPSIPEYFQYDSHVIFNPVEIAAQLQLRATDVIKRFVQLPKARGN
jgi:hypothetical protein